MMWTVDGSPVPPSWLALEPERVLYEFDGPKIFTCRGQMGELFLAYLCSEDQSAMRYLVVPFTDNLLRGLTAGDLPLQTALTQNRSWLFDVGNDWRPLRCWQIDGSRVPPGVLPKPGVLLWADLAPARNGVTSPSSLEQLPQMEPHT